MKQNLNYRVLLLFLLLLIHSSRLSARFLATKHGKVEIIGGGSLVQIEDSDSITEMMGLEICESEDEECLKRRIISEAHLDYIYTQQQKP